MSILSALLMVGQSVTYPGAPLRSVPLHLTIHNFKVLLHGKEGGRRFYIQKTQKAAHEVANHLTP